jgi:hypothetical protein
LGLRVRRSSLPTSDQCVEEQAAMCNFVEVALLLRVTTEKNFCILRFQVAEHMANIELIESGLTNGL